MFTKTSDVEQWLLEHDQVTQGSDQVFAVIGPIVKDESDEPIRLAVHYSTENIDDNDPPLQFNVDYGSSDPEGHAFFDDYNGDRMVAFETFAEVARYMVQNDSPFPDGWEVLTQDMVLTDDPVQHAWSESAAQ